MKLQHAPSALGSLVAIAFLSNLGRKKALTAHQKERHPGSQALTLSTAKVSRDSGVHPASNATPFPSPLVISGNAYRYYYAMLTQLESLISEASLRTNHGARLSNIL
jgi:hypothetical protein